MLECSRPRRRAARRGLELDDAVLDWLFRRVERDLKSLTALLDRLDRLDRSRFAIWAANYPGP